MVKTILGVLNTVLGFANLAMYGWGNHDPASLAVGIGCMFAATWFMLDKPN